MERRTFLAASSSVGIAGLAGCSNLNSTSGTSGDSPESVVNAYYDELIDAQTARSEFFHSAVVSGEGFELLNRETEVVEEDFGAGTVASEANIDQETATQIVENGETAVVEATLEWERNGEQDEDTTQLLLATDDGDWRIVSDSVSQEFGAESGSIGPQISFVFDYDIDAQTVTITHDGGDSAEAKTLHVLGDNIQSGYTGAFHEIEGSDFTANMEVSLGQAVTVAVENAAYEIDIVWRAADTDMSGTLAEDEGPRA